MIAFVMLSGRQVIIWSFLIRPPAGPLSFTWLLHPWSTLGIAAAPFRFRWDSECVPYRLKLRLRPMSSSFPREYSKWSTT